MSNFKQLIIINIRYFIIIVISYAMAFFPWDYVGRTFRDTERYVQTIIYLGHGGSERAYLGIGYWFSQPLWKIYLKFSYDFFNDYYYAIHILSFVSLIIFIDFMYKKSSLSVSIIFLLNPMFITLILDQTRMAIAVALLLVAYQLKNIKAVVLLLIFISWMIHWFSIVFVLIYMIFYIAEKYIRGRLFLVLSLITSFCIAMLIPIFVDQILNDLGGTRTSYSNNAGSSIYYSLTWLLLSISLIVFSKSELLKNDRIFTAYSIFMLSFYFFLSAIGMYGSRFFVTAIPFIVIAVSNIQYDLRRVILFFLMIYNILLWNSWLKG